jgi:hypothetical protein
MVLPINPTPLNHLANLSLQVKVPFGTDLFISNERDLDLSRFFYFFSLFYEFTETCQFFREKTMGRVGSRVTPVF